MAERSLDHIIVYDFDLLFGNWPTDHFGVYVLSQWDVQLILASLRFANWPVRWVDSNGLKLRDLGRVADLRQVEDEVAKTEWRLKMSLEGILEEGFDAWAEAIVEAAQIACSCGNGGCGAGGSGQSSEPADTQDTDNEIEDPPEGFATWAAYKAYKCDVADWIVAEMTGDASRLTTLNLVGLAVASVSAAIIPVLLTPVPIDDIVVIAGVVVAAIALGVSAQENARDLLIDHADDLMCAIYLGVDVQDSIDRFNAMVAYHADIDYPAQPLNYYIEALLAAFATPDNFNRLIVPDATQTYPSGDCGDCGIGCGTGEWVLTWGTIVSGDPTEYGTDFVIESEFVDSDPDYERIELRRRNVGDTAYTRVRARYLELNNWVSYSDPYVRVADSSDCAVIDVERFRDETGSAGPNFEATLPDDLECAYVLIRGNESSRFNIKMRNLQELE